MRFEKPKLIPLLFFLAGFGTTVALGTWQVERLHWKEGLIAEIEAAKQQPPLTKLPSDPAALAALNFHPVKLTGVWLHEIEYDVAPRYWQGKFGYALFTPLQLPDKRIIIVNRGWIPREKKEIGTRRGALVGLAATGGVITSAGLVLAGTFAVLGTLPVVTFAEIGIAVALGVLLDTLVVRSVLVTALNLDLRGRMWWPSALARRDRELDAAPLPDEGEGRPGAAGAVAPEGVPQPAR